MIWCIIQTHLISYIFTVMHPDICSIPESDIEIVNSVFTDPWPSKWTVADYTNQAVQNELVEEVGSQFQSFLPPSEMEPATPFFNAQSLDTDAEAACDSVILYFTDDFGGHGIGRKVRVCIVLCFELCAISSPGGLAIHLTFGSLY